LSRRKSTSLTASLEFERVYREGSVCRGKLFSIHALPNSVGRPRLGLSVSKKVGVAVKRNAVRRKLREIFRSAAPDLPGGVDVVVSARAAAADADFEELKQEFLAAMRKLNARHAVGESLGGDV
jgi:ribonuclease P protein component